MDFHALEAMQCMVERRKGGETGVKAVQLIEGDAVWKAGERWPLVEGDAARGALAQRHSDGRHGNRRPHAGPGGSGVLRQLVKKPAAYFIEYRDGPKATMLMLNGAVNDFNFAVKVKGKREFNPRSFCCTPEPNVTYSACLMHKVEQMFETGVAPYPVERTLLVSGMLESCLTSRIQGHGRLETPHLT